ncbi:MAG: sigma-70 family RNA polymerase sigma factor [Acidobacteria bacterium]|nr:sigma-70 family RNA polymerase sigma factor [Acidobacteriota bacterium]
MPDQHEPITDLLARWSGGDAAAGDEVLPLVYRELQAIARVRFQQESPGHTLQPTALVHETFLKLQGQGRVHWQSRSHFLSVAAHLMRRILIDHARERGAAKRGGGQHRVTLDDVALELEREVDVLALDTALDKLADEDPRSARIVELRFFAGMTVPETAAVLGVSEPTVKREWAFARAWLAEELRVR